MRQILSIKRLKLLCEKVKKPPCLILTHSESPAVSEKWQELLVLYGAMAIITIFGITRKMLEVWFVDTVRAFTFSMGFYWVVTFRASELQIPLRNF